METMSREMGTLIELARIASVGIRRHYYSGCDVIEKIDGSPVTAADQEASKILVEGLRRLYPEDSVVSEEDVSPYLVRNSTRVWYVDPIDGTREFVKGTDHFAIHIGAVVDEEPVIGLVYKPTSDEFFYGEKGLGAYRVDSIGIRHPMYVKSKDSGGLIAVGSKRTLGGRALDVIGFVNPKKVVVQGALGLRIMKVAEGSADLVWFGDQDVPNYWDLCAPHAIAKEAGVVLQDRRGDGVRYNGNRLEMGLVAARNKEIADRISLAVTRYCSDW